jgi:hypothetical protein
MSLITTQRTSVRALNPETRSHPRIADEDWADFVSEIGRRLRAEEEIAFLHPVLATKFLFE